MKLRNLIFALFLAIGAIGFTACTGDDGDTGPAGPAGPAGPPGEDGADAGAVESNYSFVTSWGKASGKIACDDPLLTGEGVFPGPELEALAASTNTVRFAPSDNSPETANGYVEITCNAAIFDPATVPDLNGDGAMGDLTGLTNSDTAPGLIFVKTHRGGDAAAVPQEGSQAATSGAAGVSITEQKSFTAGHFFADMDTRGGSDEAIERGLLYHECGVGTAPSALRGDWRAVNIVNITQNTVLSENGLEVPLANTAVTKTTSKVCLRLDSLPGAVKCYVREQTTLPGTIEPGSAAANAMAGDTEKVIIYGDGTDSMVVMPHANPMGTTNAGKLGPASGGTEVQFIGNADDFTGDKLCNLFTESAPANPQQ